MFNGVAVNLLSLRRIEQLHVHCLIAHFAGVFTHIMSSAATTFQ